MSVHESYLDGNLKFRTRSLVCPFLTPLAVVWVVAFFHLSYTRLRGKLSAPVRWLCYGTLILFVSLLFWAVTSRTGSPPENNTGEQHGGEGPLPTPAIWSLTRPGTSCMFRSAGPLRDGSGPSPPPFAQEMELDLQPPVMMWGIYPWFEERGIDLIHPDSQSKVMEESPYGKVFKLLDTDDGEWVQIEGASGRLRVAPKEKRVFYLLESDGCRLSGRYWDDALESTTSKQRGGG